MQIALYKNTKWLKAYSLAWKFVDFIYPPQCIQCRKIGYRICPTCWQQRIYFSEEICDICGSPLRKNSRCEKCVTTSQSPDKIRSLGPYRGILRNYILAMKFKRDLGLPELILPDLVALMERSNFSFDYLIPVPLSKKRLKQRGYNQVAVWGVPLGKMIGSPLNTTILTQNKETTSQVSLSADERWKNIHGAFSVNTDQIRGKNIVILDDVITTGATLNECARVLRKAGARKIFALTIARSTIKNQHYQEGGTYV